MRHGGIVRVLEAPDWQQAPEAVREAAEHRGGDAAATGATEALPPLASPGRARARWQPAARGLPGGVTVRLERESTPPSPGGTTRTAARVLAVALAHRLEGVLAVGLCSAFSPLVACASAAPLAPSVSSA